MKTVGQRTQAPVSDTLSVRGLVDAAQLSATLAGVGGHGGGLPKGVFRFRSHEDANHQQEQALLRRMSQLAARRNAAA